MQLPTSCHDIRSHLRRKTKVYNTYSRSTKMPNQVLFCVLLLIYSAGEQPACKLPVPNLVPLDESSSDEHCVADGAKSPFQLTTSTIMYHNANSSTKRCSCCAVTSNSRGWFGFRTSLFINMPLRRFLGPIVSE